MAGDRIALSAPPADIAAAHVAGRPTAGPPVALYVHVPFCVSVCPYCDFVVYAGAAARGQRNRVGAFLDALTTEIDLRADAIDARWGPARARPPLASVYFGGGTPSLLPPGAVEALIEQVRARFGIAEGAEITLEANPGPDERGDAGALARAGVTRLSLGAQRLDDTELARLGRRHGAADVREAVAAARAAGIRSVGIDLLYDIPEDTDSAWARALDAALALEPDHLSLYALTLDDPDGLGITGPLGDHLPTTAGARRWRRTARGQQDEDRAASAYLHATATLAGAGFRGYEISNWARPAHESRHNLAYWTGRPWEAFGPGAHAFDGRTRRWNAARLDGYVAALADGRLPPGDSDLPGARAAAAEALILGLRLDTGVPRAAAVADPLRDAAFAWAAQEGLVENAPRDRVRLTTRGRLLSNELFARLV